MKILFLGAPVRSPDKKLPLSERFRQVGFNTGNLLIGDSLRRQINHSEYYSATFASEIEIRPEEASDHFDMIVIPASNFISPIFDFGEYSEYIEKTRLPCSMFGLGAQATSMSDGMPNIHPGTRRFLDVVAERAVTIGVRGAFSADMMARLGHNNIEICGCPSLYRTLAPQIDFRWIDQQERPLRVSLNGSRNVCDHSFSPDGMRSVEKELIKISFQKDFPYVIQNEQPEMEIITFHERILNSNLREHLTSVLSEINISNLDANSYFDKIKNDFHIFFDVEEWDRYIRNFDFSIGSRLHGNIIALTNGVPALVFAHDTRTQEICEFAGIPHRLISEIAHVDPEASYREISLGEFGTRYKENYQRFADLLSRNGLSHNLGTSTADAPLASQNSIAVTAVPATPSS